MTSSRQILGRVDFGLNKSLVGGSKKKVKIAILTKIRPKKRYEKASKEAKNAFFRFNKGNFGRHFAAESAILAPKSANFAPKSAILHLKVSFSYIKTPFWHLKVPFLYPKVPFCTQKSRFCT